MSTKNLEKIFDPKGIAVIGASDRVGSVGYIIFNNLIGSGYDGVVFPINTKRESVQGVHAFSSILDLPHKVDLAIIATPASTTPDILEECGKAGIKGIIIISAGFAEMGEEGKELINKILDIRKKYNQRIIGPNCLGILRPSKKINASFAQSEVKPGKVAFISQSGALGTAVLDWAAGKNIGFSHFVSLGSMIDVNFADLIDYFGADNETSSIILYIESIKDARRFMSAARGFSMNKPIIVVKSGRVAEGAKAAASHTGALAGEDDVYDACFKRVGIVRVDQIDELFNCSEKLAMQSKPEGNKLAIITNAGGPGVMATDTLITMGGKLAKLSSETMEQLNKVLPPFWSRSNPVDILGDAKADRYAQALEICLKDKNIDGVLVILTPQAMTDCTETARLLVDMTKGHEKPILASWMGDKMVEEGRELLAKGNIPSYETPEEAIKTFMHLYQYTRNIELLYETPEDIIGIEQPDVKSIKEELLTEYNKGTSILSETQSKSILEKYGIKTTLPVLAKDCEDAVKIAKDIGFPVVMKIQSEDISHKSDAGCVMLDIKNTEDVKIKFDEIISNAKKFRHDTRIDGVAVQKMISSNSYEVIIGSKKDTMFGSVILFGMGGIAVEVLKDKTVGFPPLNQTWARRLMEGTKLFEIMKKGYRNIPPANLELLEQNLIRFSQLLVDLPEIKEIDINPIKISDVDCYALDARMVLDEEYYKSDNVASHQHLVISPYPKEYIKHIKIAEQDITLRPIKPEDEPMWLEMFNSFSETIKKYRFFHIINDMPHQKRIRYTFNDYDREIAIVPVAEIGGKKQILGVVRMTGDANHEVAEFAIALREKWQNKGLGDILFDYIMEIARQKGWKKMVANALADNDKILNLFKKKGCSISLNNDDGSYNIVFDII